MWEFFQIITKAGMTPNECLSLFAVNMKVTPPLWSQYRNFIRERINRI